MSGDDSGSIAQGSRGRPGYRGSCGDVGQCNDPKAGKVPDRLGLYLHIPFCESICNYCNFNRGLLDGAVKVRYVGAIEKEIRQGGDGSLVDTIYFGGGTPSLLTPAEVARLLTACRAAFDVDAEAEVTLEMNPESASVGYVTELLGAGITRISLGVQSFNDHELERLGRRHTAKRARTAMAAAVEAGCANVSLDLMLWLPAATRADCSASVDALIGLGPDHASLYILELYPNAPLRDEMARSGWSCAPDDDAAAMYFDALERTDAAGYEQYEISNVARSGKRCRHNLKYWQDGEWLGFGCGAHSTRAGCRWKNVADTGHYVEAVYRGVPVMLKRRSVPMEERLGDALFTGLRLADGIDLDVIRRRYAVDVMARYEPVLTPFLDAGLLVHTADRLRLTRSGMIVSNEIMGAFV